MVHKLRTLLSNRTSLTAWTLSLLLHGAGITLYILVQLQSPQNAIEVPRFPEIKLRVLPPEVSAPAVPKQAEQPMREKRPVSEPPPAETAQPENPEPEQQSLTENASLQNKVAAEAPAAESTDTMQASAGNNSTSEASPAAAPITWQGLTRGRVLDVPQYPDAARRFGYEGTVRALISIAEDGSITAVEVQRSSGYPILDRTVIDTVISSWSFEPPGKAIKIIKDFTFKLER